MANTYTQIHYQCVIVVKYRDAVIHDSWRDQLCAYITGILQSFGHKMLQINGVEDHLHFVFGMRPKQALSALLAIIKANSTNWINENKFVRGKFAWQPGYAAFTYSKRELPQVITYIKNQKEHHKKRTFREEYELLLARHEVDYKEEYLFHEPKEREKS